jgi:exodeoxyribonuclease V alpha subunit
MVVRVPHALFPLFMSHYMLLSRNLLYTGLTCAKLFAILIGPTKAIGVATKRVMDRQ